jgi:Icc-related predicted phosphoesterase
MGQARIPYVTVIGNHDHLSNGGKIYQQMYGPLNYSFTFHQVKFIAWDNVEWESEKETDYNWLQQALEINRDEATNEFYHHVIPFSHIPPTDGQMEDDREKFHALLKEHQVKLSVHGHRHTFSMRELYGDGIQYVTVGSPQKRNYAEIAITPDTIVVSKIDY